MNPLARVNRDVKRHADVIGIYQNDEAGVRLTGALVLEANGERAASRRYMSLETLPSVTDNPTVRLPAVATCSNLDLSERQRSYTLPRGTIYDRTIWSALLQIRHVRPA